MRINSINIVALRNNEHFQFITDVSTLLKTLPETVTTKFESQADDFAAAIADEDVALKKIMKSVITAQISAADNARDTVYRGLVEALKSAQHHFRADLRAAAVRVANTVNAYKNVTKMGDIEETSVLYNLCKDLQDKHSADVELLSLGSWITELNRLNKAVEELLMGRVIETSERPSEAMRPVRRRVDEAYRNLIVCLEAFSMIETPDNAAALEKMIAALNTLIENYSNLVAQRKGRAAAKDKDKPKSKPSPKPVPDVPADPEPDPELDPEPEPEPEPEPDLPEGGI